MSIFQYAYIYVAPAALLIGWHVRRRHLRTKALAQQLADAEAAGLNEPPSLHPVVDMTRCFGSGACVRACPEAALGVVNGKATLVNAAHCIGHGACFHACPVQAITLVFGTQKRGIDIPHISQDFETNVPGIFIAGELGGMGLIRKTAEQGRQAMNAIRKRGGNHSAALDVVVVGAGPAGISAGLSAIYHKQRYLIIEQEDSLGGSVYHYPRNKIAMTSSVKLDLIGKIKLGTEVQKEKLLAFWHEVVAKTGLKFNFNERFEGLDKRDDGTFMVRTSKAEYHSRSVLLALGRRGSPRKLEVPGEEQPKVVYRLVDPEQYRGMAVMVVGGGDSALEAALALAEEPDTTVALSYRGNAFGRVKEKNRDSLKKAEADGKLRVMLGSNILRIDVPSLEIETGGQAETLANDIVIVCAGGVLPTPLLRSIGILFETKFGRS
jgi:thioredoxin reductase/Pyruvate/2-oxoacid:ferredoxin oxidoreductase delta subunit